jgi:Uncharacterized protein conserved in bacteria
MKNSVFTALKHAAAALALVCAAPAHADKYPSHPITMVVPYAHGGITDAYARSIGDFLGKYWGTQVIVDNKGGAGTMIGTQQVSRSKPDGYTMLLTSYAFTSNPILRKDLNYDPDSFRPVMLLGNSRSMLVVNSQSDFKTLQDFIAKGKEAPGTLKLASSGNASSPHIAAELWAKELGITITHVPYRGTAPAMNDLYGGMVDGIFDGPSSISNVRSGRLRALGIAHDGRHPAAPEVPTFKEQGIDLVFGSWFGFFVPKDTPEPIVKEINTALNKALQDPKVKTILDGAGLFVSGGTPEEFADFLNYESKRLQSLVDGGVKLVVE